MITLPPPVGWPQDVHTLHLLAAGGAAHGWLGWSGDLCCLLRFWRSDRNTQQLAHALQRLALIGAEKAEVAHLAETLRQDMLQEAADELFGADGANLPLAALTVFLGKRNLTALQLENAAIADRDAKDIRR